MPAHSHKPAAAANGATKTAAGSIWAPFGAVRPEPNFYAKALTNKPVDMATGLLSPSGGGTLHNNLMPFQGLNFCIALEGVSPTGEEEQRG
jgi:microcystin-dependent protein